MNYLYFTFLCRIKKIVHQGIYRFSKEFTKEIESSPWEDFWFEENRLLSEMSETTIVSWGSLSTINYNVST